MSESPLSRQVQQAVLKFAFLRGQKIYAKAFLRVYKPCSMLLPYDVGIAVMLTIFCTASYCTVICQLCQFSVLDTATKG